MTEPHRRRVPSHLFGGKVRTATFTMCTVWLAMWLLYLFVNQPDEPVEAPSSAVIISETPYVPYVPPAPQAPVEQSVPRTTLDTPVPSTTVPPTSSAVPTVRTPTTTVPSAPTTTTNAPFPFELPAIPGFPGGNESSEPERTGESER